MDKEEKKKEKEFFIDACLKGASQVRSWLKLDETSHQMVAGYSHQDTREYYIYSVLNEIEKAGAILINYKEFFEDTGDDKKDDEKLQRIGKMILNAVEEDLSLWQRKLSELLLDLIGFQSDNKIETYRHYLYTTDLDRIQKRKSDFKEYYDCENKNIQHQINDINNQLNQLETSNPKLASTHYFIRTKKGELKLRDHRSKLNMLLKHASDAQKIVLGMSYRKYSELSNNIHSNPDALNRFIKVEDLEQSYASIGLLAIHCLIVCKRLLGKKPRKGTIAQLSKIFRENKYPKQLLRAVSMKTKIKKGDLIIAYNDLAEVIAVRKSKYGYISYKIKYLSNPPIPTILEEEFPYYHVLKYVDREFIRKKVLEEIMKHTKRVSHKQISNSIRKTIVDFWENLGGKELYRGRKDLAYEKARKHLESKAS